MIKRCICWFKGHDWGSWHPLPWHYDEKTPRGRAYGNWRDCNRCGKIEERYFD